MNGLLVLYALVGAVTASVTFYLDRDTRADARLFGGAERTLLALTCIAVGATWVLFLPTMLALVVERLRERHTGGGGISSSWDLRPIRVRS